MQNVQKVGFAKEKLVFSLDEVSRFCGICKAGGGKVVLTSGCFDLLHGGHLDHLCEAANLGDFLVVGVNSDQFVKKLKGESRPVRGQEDRAYLLAGFAPVGIVVIFDCDYALIEAVKPDIYLVSYSSHLRIWDDRKRVEILENMGTRIVESYMPKKDSTTEIIERSALISDVLAKTVSAQK